MSAQSILFVGGVMVGLTAGLLLALVVGVQPLKKEAVERGFAEWTVNSSGNVKWAWKGAVK